MDQATFDIDALIAEVTPAPVYVGRAPLGFTTAVFTLSELAEAEEFLVSTGHGFGIAVGPPHIWRPPAGYGASSSPGHSFVLVGADLGCGSTGGEPEPHYVERYKRPRSCECVGGWVYRGLCDCGWASEIVTADGIAVEQWHDHAWPGWRDLPVVPRDFIEPKRVDKLAVWLREFYGEWSSQSGAPIVTERKYSGSRHVPGRSPWGGYDLCGAVLKGDS